MDLSFPLLLAAELLFNQPWPWAYFSAGTALALLAAVLLYLPRGLDLSRRGRWVLIGLRVAVLLLLFACLLQPAIRKVVTTENDPNLVVAIDTSASMSIEDYDGPRSRVRMVQKALEDSGILDRLAEKYVLRLFEFDTEAREITGPAELRADGTSTDLGRSLDDLAQKAVDVNTIAAVLITDGADNSKADVLQAPLPFERAAVPILPVGAGAEEVRDIEVTTVSTRRIVRMNTTVETKVRIRHSGYPHHLIPVILKRGGEVIEKKEVALQDEAATVEFEFTPIEEGMLRYRVEVPPQPGEVITENNARDFSVNSSRRKIRALYMEGSQYKRPESKFWEFQYLVQALLEDKDVEMVPLFRDDVQAAAEAGISYMTHPDKGFPRTRKDLFKYDVIISSDIDIQLFTESQLKNIVEFVGEFGGGFCMVGGWTSFGAGGYDESIIDQMLPVDMLGRQDRYTENIEIKWELTPEAYHHPIMRLVDDPEKNRAIWKSIPPFYGYNNVLRAKPAATVLALHPYETTKYGRKVLLAVQKYGKGRSMAFMPDTTAGWGKDFEDSFGEKDDNRYFRKFWKNAVRWLAAYRLNVPNQLVTVHTDLNIYEQDEKARIEVSVLNKDYLPSRDAEVELEVETPDGESFTRKLAADLQRDGIYTWELPASSVGDYELRARARDAQGLIGEDRAAFQVQASSREFRDYALNRALLVSFASRTHGKYYDLEHLKELAPDLEKANRKTVQTETRDLWDNPLVYLLMLGLLSVEWILRKRNGLP